MCFLHDWSIPHALICHNVIQVIQSCPIENDHVTHQQGTCTHCWLQFRQQRFYWTAGRRLRRLCAQNCRSPYRCRAPAAQTGCRGRPAHWSDTGQSPAGAAVGLCSVPQWSHIHWLHSPPGTPKATEKHSKTHYSNSPDSQKRTISSKWETVNSCSHPWIRKDVQNMLCARHLSTLSLSEECFTALHGWIFQGCFTSAGGFCGHTCALLHM